MKRNSLRAACAVALVSLQFGAFAQTDEGPKSNIQVNPNGVTRCYTMEMDALKRANNPGMPTMEEEETWLQQKIVEYKASMANNPNAKATQLTLPIIFHIFTDGSGAENVSEAQIQAQVAQMNIDFGDLAGSSYGVSSDIEVEFCLAALDENGTPLVEPGINRITSYGQGPFSSNDFEGGMKSATQWNPDDYVNVWVANLSGGLLGYADWPTSSGLSGVPGPNGGPGEDGVVIVYSSVGSVASPFPGGAPYNLGRTLTHEIGHWLGLRHIWGDGGCGVDDFCDDTPMSDGSNFNCPNVTNCSSVDMVENYMDYTDDNCMNTFTEDQKTRIRAVLLNSPRRSTLANSLACNLSSDPDDAGVSAIISPTGSACSSGFTPEVTITNFGSNDITSLTINYDIDGGTASTQAWTGTLAVGNSTNVTLPYMNSSGTHTFNAWTTSPNGGTDPNSGNDASASTYTLTAGGQIITFNLTTDCWGEEQYWELKDVNNNLVYSGGNTGVTIPPGAGQIGTTQADAGAYPSDATTAEDWCLAEGCYDFVIYDDWGDGMNGSTEPNCAVDGTYSITDQWGAAYVTMQQVNFGGSEASNFCISLSVEELPGNNVNVYPNPSEGMFNVVMKDFSGEEQHVVVTDLTGRVVTDMTVSAGTFQLDLSDAASGSYTMTIESASHRTSKRLVVKN